MKRKIDFSIVFPWLLLVLLLPCSVLALEPVKIAAIFARTGPAVVVSGERPEFSAIQLAVQQLNEQGGLLGHPIEVVELDNQSTALGSKQAAEEAVRAKVIAVIGASRSSHSLGMAPVFQEAEIPMISPISTNPQVTEVGNYIFRVCFIDDFQGQVMAAFAARELRAESAVVLTNTSEKFSLSLARFFIDMFQKTGGRILWEGDYLGDAVDFQKQLLKIKELQPDVCFVPGYDTDTGFIVKQARELGIDTVFLSGDGVTADLSRYGGNTVSGVYYSSHWHLDDPDPVSRRFVESYRKSFPATSDAVAALSYDAVMLLADAVRRAQSTVPRHIREALASTEGFKGVTGDITFDENRNPKSKRAVIISFEKGIPIYHTTFQP